MEKRPEGISTLDRSLDNLQHRRYIPEYCRSEHLLTKTIRYPDWTLVSSQTWLVAESEKLY